MNTAKSQFTISTYLSFPQALSKIWTLLKLLWRIVEGVLRWVHITLVIIGIVSTWYLYGLLTTHQLNIDGIYASLTEALPLKPSKNK